MSNFSGKVVLINGAGPGFGRVASQMFAEQGARIIAADLLEENARKTAETIIDNGGEAVYCKCDSTVVEEVVAAVETGIDAFGKIDVLYNNAGLQGPPYWCNILDGKIPDAHRAINVNIRGIWNYMRTVAPYMKENGGGCIVNMSSAAGVKGGCHSYGATKSCNTAMSRCAATELGKYNIRVNSVSPYISITPFKAHSSADPVQARLHVIFKKVSPLRTMADMYNVGHAITYLASDEADGITGMDFRVDTGVCVRSLQINEDLYAQANSYHFLK